MVNNKKIMKKVWNLLTSMRFGMFLLLIIALLSVLATVIPQGYSSNYYEASYSGLVYELIIAFSLYNVFESWWFISLTVILSTNLILCSIRRIKNILRRVFGQVNIDIEYKKVKEWNELNIGSSELSKFFEILNFNKIIDGKVGPQEVYYSDRDKIGHLGSWLTHLGILLIIVSFTYGKIKGFDLYLAGVPGETIEVDNTDLSIYIEDFQVEFRDDFSVSQYISDVTVLKNNEEQDSGRIMVNHPLRTNNLNIYQNATGWAVNTTLYKNGKEYSKKLLYEGDFFIEDNQKIALQFTSFYPDLDHSAEGLRSKSPMPNHPVMLYAIFYDGYRVDMNLIHMGDSIEYEEYRFTIDEPVRYTVFQVAKDPGKLGALFGGGILILGIYLAMFLNPRSLVAYVSADGKVKVYGHSHKNNLIYQENINEALEKIRRN